VKQATATTTEYGCMLTENSLLYGTVELYVAFVLKNLNYGFSLQKALTGFRGKRYCVFQ
jgi:hypothetical protein